MNWFFKKKQRSSEELSVSKINFIGEQDGVPERELKSALNLLSIKNGNVLSAYLARVEYGDPSKLNVALCIRSEKQEDIKLKREAGRIFSSQFGTHEHLDIIFLRKDQETDLRQVCKPFYKK